MDTSKHESQEIMISNTSNEHATRQQEEPNNKYELTVDEVMEQHIGPFGFAEIMQAFLVSIPLVFVAQISLMSIYSDAQPGARFVATHTEVERSSLCGLSTGEWEWIGGNESTIVAEWNLICQHKFLVALPSTLFFIGSLFGSGVYGYLADSLLGRKKTLFLSCILAFVTAFMISFSPNIWVYAFLRFTNGVFKSGIGTCCVVLATEVVGKKWRGQAGQYGFFFFALGFLSLPLMAYVEKNSWRKLYRLVSYLPLGYAILTFPFIVESPRWLLVKGRNKEAIEVLEKLAWLNGKKLPTDLNLLNPFSARDGIRASENLVGPKIGTLLDWR